MFQKNYKFRKKNLRIQKKLKNFRKLKKIRLSIFETFFSFEY